MTFAENFRGYQAERAILIPVLQGLTLAQWNRAATFTGKAKTTTVFDEMKSMAQHDTAHCNQLETMFPK